MARGEPSPSGTGTQSAPRRRSLPLDPREEWVQIPVPAIISEDTFEAVQKAAHDSQYFQLAAHRAGHLFYCGGSCAVATAGSSSRPPSQPPLPHGPLLPVPAPRPGACRWAGPPLPRTACPRRRARQLRLRPGTPTARSPPSCSVPARPRWQLRPRSPTTSSAA